MGWLARIIDAGQEYRKPLVDMEDDLFLDIGGRRAKLTKFWVQLVLASVIAAGGVIGNSTPAVIGAMIIAPLGTPIYGLALAAVIGERHALRRSLLLLVGGIAVNILIGVLIGLVTVNRMPLDANPQVVAARRRRCSTSASPSPSASPARSRSRARTSPTSSPAWPSPSRWSRCSPSSASRSAAAARPRARRLRPVPHQCRGDPRRRRGRVHGRRLQARGAGSRRPRRPPRHDRHRRPRRRPAGPARGCVRAHAALRALDQAEVATED